MRNLKTAPSALSVQLSAKAFLTGKHPDVVEFSHPVRPADLAEDHATIDSAVRHAIEASGDDANHVVILYGNIPVRPSDLIDRANHNMSTDLWESLYQNGSGASSQAESEYGDVLQPFERHSCGLCQQTHHLSIDLCAARRQLEAEEEEDHQQAEALAKLATSV